MGKPKDLGPNAFDNACVNLPIEGLRATLVVGHPAGTAAIGAAVIASAEVATAKVKPAIAIGCSAR